MQRHQHRYRHQQDQEISHHIQYPIREIQILQMHALSREQRVPKLGDGMTFENEGEADGDHVANGDEEDKEYLVTEIFRGIDAQVEEEDGDFGKGHSGDVDDHGGGGPLVLVSTCPELGREAGCKGEYEGG